MDTSLSPVNYRDYIHCHKLGPGTDIGQLLCLGFQMGGHDTSVRSEIIAVPCLSFDMPTLISDTDIRIAVAGIGRILCPVQSPWSTVRLA